MVHTCHVATAAVEQYCQAEGVTAQAFGQSAWALLLAAYSGESVVTFGTVFSTRANSESHNIAFPSIATLPVSCDTSKPSTALLQSMVDYNSRAQRYRFTPLSEIHQIADEGVQTTFDTVFVYQKTSTFAKCFSWRMIRDSARVEYVASLELELPAGGQVKVRLTYDSGRIPDDHAALILRQYEHNVDRLVRSECVPECHPPELYSVLPAVEQELPSQVKLLHQFVEAGASDFADKVALEFVTQGEKTKMQKNAWTYRELNDSGNQVANLLHEHGVKPDSIVAVCMAKCAAASLAFVGILKAGCSFLALDPDLPPARQNFILEDSQAQLVFCAPNTTKDDLEVTTPVVALDEDSLAAYSDAQLHVESLSPEKCCYVLYTSGTTGNPKGCEVSHHNAVQAMLAFQRIFAGRWDSNSRWLQFASYWFDVSVLEHFWSWSVGITVVGAPRDLVLADIAGFIRSTGITHIDLTPSLARLLHPQDAPSLHRGVFITGGEALKQDVIDKWGAIGAVCNGYGPTEATIGVTMNPFIGVDAKPSNIGKQFLNVGSYVLAPDTEDPVLRGAVGELCVCGPLVGKGYLNRSELTAKHFPTLKRDGERVYRTGDLVRLLSNDSFAFVGRKDTQAKLRGQRLELAEIDSVIKSSAKAIEEVTSLVHRSSADRQTLVSFVATGNRRTTHKLKVSFSDSACQLLRTVEEACRASLPAYMVPAHVVPISFLPLTVNNKIDTKRLASLFESLGVHDLQLLKHPDQKEAVLGAVEIRVRDAVSRLLAIDKDKIGHATNVFSLGLSSVSAITLASLLKRDGFGNASVAMIMKSQYVALGLLLIANFDRSHHWTACRPSAWRRQRYWRPKCDHASPTFCGSIQPTSQSSYSRKISTRAQRR